MTGRRKRRATNGASTTARGLTHNLNLRKMHLLSQHGRQMYLPCSIGHARMLSAPGMVTTRRTWRATDGAATIRMPRGHPRLGAPQKIASRSEHDRTRFPGTNYGHAIILSAARVASVRRAMGANHTARTRDSCNQKLINCFRRTHLPSVIGRARTTLRRIHTWSEEWAIVQPWPLHRPVHSHVELRGYSYDVA